MMFLQIFAVLLSLPGLSAHGNDGGAARLELVETFNFIRSGWLTGLHWLRNNETEHPCRWDGSTLGSVVDAYAVVPIASLHYIASRADLVPVPCVSNLVVHNLTATTNLSFVSIPIIRTCAQCPSNYFFLSSAALLRLGLETETAQPVAIDTARYHNMPEMWPKINISRDALGKQIQNSVQKSMLKNSLRWGDQCSQNKNAKRSIYRSGNFSYMFQQNLDIQRGLELNHKLDQIDRIPGPLCNIYQGLTCSTDNRCDCKNTYIKEDPVDLGTLLLECILGAVQEGACMLDLQFEIERTFGARVGQHPDECFLHRICHLVQDGEMCEPSQHRRFAAIEDNPYLHYKYFIRFPVENDPNSSECICMEPYDFIRLIVNTQVSYRSLKLVPTQNNLEYGEMCNVTFEELRRNHSNDLRALDHRLDPAIFEEGTYENLFSDVTARARFGDGLSFLRKSNGTFCKAYKHLMCTEAGFCECNTQGSDGVSFIREDEVCVLKTGSICDSDYWNGRFENYVSAYENDAELPKCRKTEVCVDPRTGKLCQRNDTLPRISFQDKLFPYFSPELSIGSWEHINRTEDYCRCGQTFEIGKPLVSNSRSNIVMLGVAVIILVTMAVASFIWNRHRLREIREHYLSQVLPDDLITFAKGCEVDTAMLDEAFIALCARYRKEEFEISTECISFGAIIGSGAFGIVQKGAVDVGPKGTTTQVEVAIKKCTFSNVVPIMDSVRALLAEIKLLQYIQDDGAHSHVVAMLHAVTAPESGAPMLILEFCEKGNLEQVLMRVDRTKFYSQINHHGALDLDMVPPFSPYTARPDATAFNTKQLLMWAHQVSSGMAFLHDRKRLIHGDLFTRNVLIDANNRAKVSDFGIAKQLQNPDKDYARYNEKEIRANDKKFWPPEACLDGGKLTPPFDVWTFGAVLWEIFSLGEAAGANCKTSLRELGKPAYANEELCSLIRECWVADPDQRITFGSSGRKGSRDKLQDFLTPPDTWGDGSDLNQLDTNQWAGEMNVGEDCMPPTEMHILNS